MKAAWFVTAVLIAAIAGPVAAQAPAGQATPDRPVAGASSTGRFSAADVVSLSTIRKGLVEAGGPKAIHPALASVGQPAAPFIPASTPVFRTQVVAYRPTTFEESLQEAVARPWQPARPGFLGGPMPGVSGGAPVLVGVSFDPAIIVRWVQKKARARAVANAKREVAEELDAFLKARGKSATEQAVK